MVEASSVAGQNADRIRDALASRWTLRGIELLAENTRESLLGSLRCFEQAIALRRSLPAPEDPWFRYGLTAGWMNRGDALTRLGDDPAEAVRSYDEALALLGALPIDAHPLFRRRHAIAWMNRGIALQESGIDLDEALISFDRAIAAVSEPAASELGEHRLLLACAVMNRANALLRLKPAQAAEAQASATQAVELLSGIEQAGAVAAETGLKARHVLCQAAAELLARSETKGEMRDELIAIATDSVESAMSLARLWERKGELRFRPLSDAIFRFGARVYQVHQPHFLAEFLLENLDPSRSPDAIVDSAAMHAAAAEALSPRQISMPPEGFASLKARLRELRLTRERIEELRRSRGLGDEPPTRTAIERQ